MPALGQAVGDQRTGVVDLEQLLAQFREAMIGIYDAALQLTPPYRPTKFLRMVNERGVKETADILADGFIHVRHIKQLSEIGEKYEVDSLTCGLSARTATLSSTLAESAARSRK
jgi:hypothetical protein